VAAKKDQDWKKDQIWKKGQDWKSAAAKKDQDWKKDQNWKKGQDWEKAQKGQDWVKDHDLNFWYEPRKMVERRKWWSQAMKRSWQDWWDSLPEEEKNNRRRERIVKRIHEGWFTAEQVREIIMAPVTRIVVDEDSKETKDETVPVAETARPSQTARSSPSSSAHGRRAPGSKSGRFTACRATIG